MPYLVAIFNNIMSTGIFPSKWAKGIIVPFHKKGNVNSVNNYCWIPLGKKLLQYLITVYNDLQNCLKRLQNPKQALDKVTVLQIIFLRYIV